MFVNDSRATNTMVRGTYCSADYELLSVSFRPHYLPREFGQITLILVLCAWAKFFTCSREHCCQLPNGVTQLSRRPSVSPWRF